MSLRHFYVFWILNQSAKYYHQYSPTKKACERYQSLSKEKKKEENQQYGRDQYKNLLEDEKESLLSIEKNIVKWEKMPNKKLLF